MDYEGDMKVSPWNVGIGIEDKLGGNLEDQIAVLNQPLASVTGQTQ